MSLNLCAKAGTISAQARSLSTAIPSKFTPFLATPVHPCKLCQSVTMAGRECALLLVQCSIQHGKNYFTTLNHVQCIAKSRISGHIIHDKQQSQGSGSREHTNRQHSQPTVFVLGDLKMCVWHICRPPVIQQDCKITGSQQKKCTVDPCLPSTRL